MCHNYFCTVLKKFVRNPWPNKFENEIAPKAKTNNEEILKNNTNRDILKNYEYVKISYSSTRLLFKKDEIEPLDWNDKFRIYASNDNCTYEMTKKEFYDVFSNVVKTRSYLKAGIYHYV